MSVKLLNFQGKKFSCIIGMNILSKLDVFIDFSAAKLRVGNKLIPFVEDISETVDLANYSELMNYCTEVDKFPYFEAVDSSSSLNIDALLSKDLNEEEKKALRKFLPKYKHIFYQDGQVLSAVSRVKHKIITTPHTPIYCKNYRYPYALEEEINRQIDEMLKNGIIRPSNSPYNSPLWIVEKHSSDKNVKKWRLVIDYRKLNNVTIDDKFPLPNIESLFEKLGRANYFSTIDLAKGFHQILMDPNDIEKTAFSSPKGHFEYVCMSFGLKNAPATFQRMMNNVLDEYINKICVIYMDDILIFSTSLNEHIQNLTKIFDRLTECNLKIQYDKCQFLSKHTKFLGHVISADGIKPSADKIQAIQQVKLPTTVQAIKSFLGLSGYYRKFIHNYAFISAPIVKYLKKDAVIDINDLSYIEAFNKLKMIMSSPPLLVFPNFSKKFVLTTDASDVALGAVLSQDNKPISFASRTLNGAEKGYYTMEKELLAIVWAMRYFRPYLYGRKFLVQTDHQPLKALYNMKESSRILRWRALIEEYDFDVDYIEGRENKVADFLSRQNIQCEDNVDIKSLFENSIATVHSAQEDGNNHFLISDFIVNKYTLQIRLVENKSKETEKLFNKYTVVYISAADLQNGIYLTDLCREHIKKGKVGIHSELPDNQYNILQEKLINLYANDTKVSFTRCTKIAIDVQNKDEMLELIEKEHNEGNHRGVTENYEKLKWIYFYPNLQKLVNKFINSCNICSENKYDRKPLKKCFQHTDTPSKPNEIVHADIFYVCRTMFLTTIDRFTKMATVHKLSDKNMCTVIVKLQERNSWLGKPENMIFDNEFNNTAIRMFCRENNITVHFTTPNSHTGNADVERFHSTLLEHIRIIRNSNPDTEIEIEETVIRAVGFYNNSVHGTIKLKPFDFINENIDFEIVKKRMEETKNHAINKINEKREEIPDLDNENIFLRNPLACRNKVAKRYLKINRNYPNKIDMAHVKRPNKTL